MAADMEPWLLKSNLEQWLQTPVTECVEKNYEGKGENFLTDMHRLTVETTAGNKDAIVKCRKKEGTAADILKESTMFSKEQQMYGDTLPRMEQMLKKVLPKNLAELAPKCWYSSNDFLVMEDLSTVGYKMMNRRAGLNLEQCISLMHTIARFHAASVAVYEESPESMELYRMSFFSEPSTYESWSNCFKAMAKMLIEELETWPAEKWSPYLEKIKVMKDGILERILKVSQKRDSDFNVLLHGDLWVNNVLYKSNNIVRLIDFQIVNFSSFAIDLQYFLTTSPNMDVRLNHLDALIKEYHTMLNSTLMELGCKRKLLTLDELYDEYHRKSMYGVFGLVSPTAMQLADPGCGYDIFEAMKGRTPGRKMYSDYYKKVVEWHLPLLDKMGGLDYK